MKILKIISGIILGIGLVILLFAKSCNKDNDEPEKGDQNKTETVEYQWQIEKTIAINFASEYGEVYKGVGPGTNTSSQNATEPYCVENKIEESCFQKDDDMFKTIGNSTNNNKLRFKSQNGKTGSIEIIFWVWIKN
jgi:hypothetical protein